MDGEIIEGRTYYGTPKSIGINQDIPEGYNEFIWDIPMVIVGKDGSVVTKKQGSSFDSEFNDYIENITTSWETLMPGSIYEIIFDFENKVWYINDEIKGSISDNIAAFILADVSTLG